MPASPASTTCTESSSRPCPTSRACRCSKEATFRSSEVAGARGRLAEEQGRAGRGTRSQVRCRRAPRTARGRAHRAVRPPRRSERALDLVGQLAEGAQRAGRHLAAARALLELHALRALEGRASLVEEAEEEVVLGAGGGVLHAVEDLLVGDRRGADGER